MPKCPSSTRVESSRAPLYILAVCLANEMQLGWLACSTPWNIPRAIQLHSQWRYHSIILGKYECSLAIEELHTKDTQNIKHILGLRTSKVSVICGTFVSISNRQTSELRSCIVKWDPKSKNGFLDVGFVLSDVLAYCRTFCSIDWLRGTIALSMQESSGISSVYDYRLWDQHSYDGENKLADSSSCR